MSEKSTELGQWVDELFYDIFFQPDGGLAQIRIEDGLDSGLTIRINGQALTADDWIKAVLNTRAQHELKLVSSREILASHKASSLDGSVAHLSTFNLTNKVTGKQKTESSLTMATVVEKSGKRVLKELTEIYLAAE